MERRDIEIFLTLAEERHFGRTAERLRVSTARVSQAIGKMERRIGAALFERTSRRVTLTLIGEQLEADLRPAFEQIERGLERAIAAGRGMGGVLRVGYVGPAAGRLILETIPVFAAQYPDCEVEIQEVQNGQGVAPLRMDQVDILFLCFPFREPDLVSGPVLISEPRMLTVSSRHPFARRASVSLEDLARDKLICVRPAPGIPERYWEESRAPTHTPGGKPIERGPAATTFQEMLALAGAGRGILVVGAQTERYFPRPDVVYLPFHDAPPVEWGLLWRASGETQRVKAFSRTTYEVSRRMAGGLSRAA